MYNYRDLKKYIYGVEPNYEDSDDTDSDNAETRDSNNFSRMLSDEFSEKEKHLLGNSTKFISIENHRTSELERLEAENKIKENGLDESNEFDIDDLTNQKSLHDTNNSQHDQERVKLQEKLKVRFLLKSCA